jgi:predicted nucleotidyltransferase
MGMKSRPRRPAATGLADALFSKTQQRVLGLLFGDPTRSYYASEIVARAHGGTGTVVRELARLEASGLVRVSRVGNQKHFQANTDAPIFEELRHLVAKTVGLADPLRRVLAPLTSRISAAFVYGSVARATDTARSDIDLMVISDELTYGDLYSTLQAAGEELGRPVNPTIYTPDEFKRRLKARNAFLTKVIALPKLWIIGSDDDLAA